MVDTLITFFADPWKAVASIAAAAAAFSGIPQAVRIFRSRSARDVSISMWLILWVALGTLAVYTWVRVPDTILRVQYVLASIINTVIVFGIFRYRKPH